MTTSYAERRALGLCPRCGKQPPAPGHTRCDDCLKRIRDNAFFRHKVLGGPTPRAKDRARLRCGNCRARMVCAPRTLCNECLRAERERKKERRAAAAAQGMCGRCGLRLPLEGKRTCQECRDARIAIWQARLEQGLCPRCPSGAPLVAGSKQCLRCRLKRRGGRDE